jgi:hypothetical protein
MNVFVVQFHSFLLINCLCCLLQTLPTCPVRLNLRGGLEALSQQLTASVSRLHCPSLPTMPAIRGRKGWCGCLQVSVTLKVAV